MNLLPVFDERFDDGGASREHYRQLRAQAANFLRKLLKYGDEAFDLCSRQAAQRSRVADRVLLALTRHVSSQLDSVTVLLEAGAVEGCAPLLRSMLEATFGIAHVVQERSEERALAYQLVRMKRHIKHLRRGDRTHPDGRQLEAELACDAFTPLALTILPSGLAAKADECEREMNGMPEMAPILVEWERVKRPAGLGRQKDPEWFSLFGGARDIRGLAKQLNWVSLYDFLYREFSHSAHAGNVLENYACSIEGTHRLRPLRYPARYASAFSLAFAIHINALEKLASFFDGTMAQQIRDHGTKRLNPEHERIADRVNSALAAFK